MRTLLITGIMTLAAACSQQQSRLPNDFNGMWRYERRDDATHSVTTIHIAGNTLTSTIEAYDGATTDRLCRIESVSGIRVISRETTTNHESVFIIEDRRAKGRATMYKDGVGDMLWGITNWVLNQPRAMPGHIIRVGHEMFGLDTDHQPHRLYFGYHEPLSNVSECPTRLDKSWFFTKQ